MTFRSIIAIVALLAFPIPAQAVLVDFADLPDSNSASLTIGDLTVTGSGNVVVDFGIGVGISDNTMQAGEFIDFSFGAPAITVSYGIGLAVDSGADGLLGERTLEVFAVGGASLGSFAHDDTGFFPVSTLVGNVPIERFRLTALESFGIRSVFFNITQVAVSEVPVPAALPLFAAGLGLMGVLGWRRKRKMAAAMAAA